MARNKAYLNSSQAPESDECYTPELAVRPLIPYLKQRGYEKVWCPFDKSDSAYVTLLSKTGFNVRFSHIDDVHEEGDFFKNINSFEALSCDVIVSNPPFSLKDQILEALYNSGKPFAILLPQNSLQSVKRTGMFIEHGLEYMGFDRRIPFYTSNSRNELRWGNHFASGYFCKDVLPEKLIFKKLVKA